MRSKVDRDKIRMSAGVQLIAWAKRHPCSDCGTTYSPHIMDLDHRPGTEKRCNVGNGKKLALSSLVAEIAKCDTVCANCHRDRTYRRSHGH